MFKEREGRKGEREISRRVTLSIVEFVAHRVTLSWIDEKLRIAEETSQSTEDTVDWQKGAKKGWRVRGCEGTLAKSIIVIPARTSPS